MGSSVVQLNAGNQNVLDEFPSAGLIDRNRRGQGRGDIPTALNILAKLKQLMTMTAQQNLTVERAARLYRN